MANEEGPKYHDTKQIPAVQVSGNTLDAVLREVRAMRADVALVANDVTIIRERVRIVEKRVDEIDARQTNNSERVKGESKANADQDATIAAILVKQDELATALAKREASMAEQLSAIATALAPVWKSPMVRKLGSAIVAVLLLAVAVLGARLEMQLAELKAKPVAVQPAPTVYLPAPAALDDGGVQ